jgi:RNA polymerase sigma-54 factor
MYQIQRQTTRPQITAHLAQTMTLLTKSVEELNEEIEKELAANPALELNDEVRCPTCNRIIPKTGFCTFCTKPKSMSADETVVFISPRTDFITHSEQFDDDKPDEQMAVMMEDLPVVILRQIATELAKEDRPIAAYLLNQLDEDGLLNINFEELASYFHVNIERIKKIQNLIQHADPLGVGSSSSQEALLIQIDFLSGHRKIPAGVREIIQHGFSLLEHANYREITRTLKFSKEVVKTAVIFIKDNLNPFPARANWGTERQPDSFEKKNYLHPDILVNHLNNDINNPLMVEIIMPIRGTLQLNPVYKESIKQAENGVREEMKEDLEKASLFIKCLQQRNNTMQRLLERIISIQKDFLSRGEQHMKPLTRAQIAKELQVHESTISRAVANKSLKLPSGEVVPLSRFFERNLNIRAVIHEIIDQESKPLSDTQIREVLKHKGINIARRTVAKYRSMDGYLPAHLRKAASQ